MRKVLPAIILAAGAFFLTMGLLFRFYAYPKLAVVPVDQNSQQVAYDPNAKYADVKAIKKKGPFETSGPITTTATVIGNKEASENASEQTGKDLAVWQTGQYTVNDDPEPPPMDGKKAIIVFDRHTGEAVNCCGESQDDQDVAHKGQLVKWPFRTEQKTYEYWDATTEKAYPATYKGTESIDGLTVYRFEQDVPKTKFMTQEVPRFIYKPGDKGGPVQTDRYYSNHRTFWIEPETGVRIKLQEEQKQTLEATGYRTITALETTSTFTEDTVKKKVDEYKSKATALKAVRLWAPLALSLLGALLLLGGLLMAVLSGRRGQAVDDPGYVIPPRATAEETQTFTPYNG